MNRICARLAKLERERQARSPGGFDAAEHDREFRAFERGLQEQGLLDPAAQPPGRALGLAAQEAERRGLKGPPGHRVVTVALMAKASRQVAEYRRQRLGEACERLQRDEAERRLRARR